MLLSAFLRSAKEPNLASFQAAIILFRSLTLCSQRRQLELLLFKNARDTTIPASSTSFYATLATPMKLVCKSHFVGDVVVIRGVGRIVAGEEIQTLRLETEKSLLETKKFVLQLKGVAYIDSGGLGGLVRLLGTLRAAKGDLKLCELSLFLKRVFDATDLKGLFEIYGTEKEAVQAFCRPPQALAQDSKTPRPKVICVDTSGDLLAYLSAVLKRSNYQVYTAKFLSDATTLARSTRPRLAVCGPSTQENPRAFEKFRQADPCMQILVLPEDFQASEAGQAGSNLVEQIGALLSTQQ